MVEELNARMDRYDELMAETTARLRNVEAPPIPPRQPRRMDLSVMKPAMFRGSDSVVDPRSWLSRYNTFGDLSDWDEVHRAHALRLFLEGPAEVWYCNLGEEITGDWDRLQDAFLDDWVNNRPQWVMHHTLDNRMQRSNEPVEMYMNDILLQGAKLGLTDKELMKALVKGLKPAIKAYVMGHQPTTAKEVQNHARVGEMCLAMAQTTTVEDQTTKMAAMAPPMPSDPRSLRDEVKSIMMEYLVPPPPVQAFRDRMPLGPPVCRRCNRPGHHAAACRQDLRCGRCNRMGHVAATCRQDIRCRRCNRLGHMERNCRVRLNNNQGNRAYNQQSQPRQYTNSNLRQNQGN